MDQWQESLSRMEASLAAAGRALDRSEERWEMAVAPSAGEGELPPALDRLDARLQEWEAKLQAAGALTAEVEKELAERAAGAARWRDTFARWAELLQRPAGTSPAS
jgi:hypothetical protein